jgi:hypothetical protein
MDLYITKCSLVCAAECTDKGIYGLLLLGIEKAAELIIDHDASNITWQKFT